jgi:hypothetical protein
MSASDPRQRDLDAPDHAPSWLSGLRSDAQPIPQGDATDRPSRPAPRRHGETGALLRPVESQDSQVQKRADNFAEALAKVMQEEFETEPFEAPFLLRKRETFGVGARFAAAATLAAVVALLFVSTFPGPRGTAEENTLSAPPTGRSLKSSLLPRHERAATLVVRDGSGTVNEPLSLGVEANSPGSGAMVTILGMPDGARLTVGSRTPAGEWRVAARKIADTSIVPPADFIGVMNLTVALHDSDAAAPVNGFVRLSWMLANPGNAIGVSASAAPRSPESPAAAPQQPQQQPAGSLEPAGTARAESPMREIDPNEVADYVRRAQQLMADGDLQAARLLLLRATEAHDARAALALANSFESMPLKQLGATDPEPDPAQARIWYQKAREWGAPGAKDQFDALASYSR